MIEIKLPKDCFCFSLKTGCLIIGFVILVFSLLFFVDTIVHVILYEHKKMTHHSEWPDITYHIFRVLVFEYGTTSQLVFSLYLLYGIYTDKSYFTSSWLICEASYAISFILLCIFTNILRSPVALENITCFVLLVVAMITVLSYYMDQPKAITYYL